MHHGRQHERTQGPGIVAAWAIGQVKGGGAHVYVRLRAGKTVAMLRTGVPAALVPGPRWRLMLLPVPCVTCPPV